MKKEKIPPEFIDEAIDMGLELIPDTPPTTKGGKIVRIAKKVLKFIHKYIKVKNPS